MNGRDWRKLDTGFRGDVYRFSVYADSLQAQDLVQTCKLVLADGGGESEESADEYDNVDSRHGLGQLEPL